MIFTFKCPDCGTVEEVSASIAKGPPRMVVCTCDSVMERDWKTDAPMLDTSACRDHNFIPHQKRITEEHTPTKAQAARREQAYVRDIAARRKATRDGGNRGKIRQTMAVPAELFHGKIRETGDKNYWNDKKNVSHHSDFKVTE